jgi:hypothetical protein
VARGDELNEEHNGEWKGVKDEGGGERDISTPSSPQYTCKWTKDYVGCT